MAPPIIDWVDIFTEDTSCIAISSTAVVMTNNQYFFHLLLVSVELQVAADTWLMPVLLGFVITLNSLLDIVLNVCQPRRAVDTSTNWRQSLFCCCTASMEQATNGAETAAIKGLISRDHSFPRQILPNSAAPFAKFRSSPRKILGIPRLTTAAHFRVTVPTLTQL